MGTNAGRQGSDGTGHRMVALSRRRAATNCTGSSSPHGSLYLHCDATASPYLKVILDTIFDPRNVCNEIVWPRHNARSTTGRWPRAT
jgi:hypothetical protein